jgi:hypothetical protein
MVSEPGSPQDIAMSTDDEEMADDSAVFSQARSVSPLSNHASELTTSNTWRALLLQRENRVPTPILPPSRPSIRPVQLHGEGARQHVRQRHPQENISSSSDHLEVPSPIDEDEVPTPPSAAEAAGSQLSMLTVNDMEVEPRVKTRLPSISIDTSETLRFPHTGDERDVFDMDSAIVDDNAMDSANEGREPRLIVRRQRQRSGALSSGQGSPQPLPKRGLSLGFRADCEKCRNRVPGHFNHFVS